MAAAAPHDAAKRRRVELNLAVRDAQTKVEACTKGGKELLALRLKLGEALCELGLFQLNTERNAPVAASTLSRAAQEQRKAMAKRMFKDVVLAVTLAGQAEAAAIEGDREAALKFRREELTVREDAQGKEHLDVAATLNAQAALLYGTGNTAAAIAAYERAIRIRRKESGDNHHTVAGELMNLANVLGQEGRFAESMARYEEALAVQQADGSGSTGEDVARTMSNMAKVRTAEKRIDEAVDLLGRAIAVQKKESGEKSHFGAVLVGNLGAVLRQAGRHDEAVSTYERAAELWKELTDGKDENPGTAEAHFMIGLTRFDQERFPPAQEHMRLAQRLFTACIGEKADRTQTIANFLRRFDILAEIRAEDEEAKRKEEAKAREAATVEEVGDEDGDEDGGAEAAA